MQHINSKTERQTLMPPKAKITKEMNIKHGPRDHEENRLRNSKRKEHRRQTAVFYPSDLHLLREYGGIKKGIS